MKLNEQNNGTVFIDGSGRRLPILEARRGSSARYWVIPQFPVSEMYLKIGNPEVNGWIATVKMMCHPKRGSFSAFVEGVNFTGRYETIYQVVMVDENGSESVCGEGVLRVYDSKIGELG